MSSSPDLDAHITQHIKEKKGKKSKKKSKPKHPVGSEAKNEGDDPHWAYEPPPDAVLVDHTVDAGAFEWDALEHDEDTEIWVIRAPDSLKPTHLDGLDIDLPSASRTARIGGLTRKTVSYDVWSVGEDDADLAGGEELRGLACLLPRERKHGRLYIAPKQISRHIVISATPSTATPPGSGPVVCQNPPRASYPKDVLKHAFVPYGARSKQVASEEVPMDVDVVEHTQEKPVSVVAPKDKLPRSKGKKRKVEAETPKKSKKHKTES